MLSTVDMVVQRRDGPRRLRDHDDDDDDLSCLAGRCELGISGNREGAEASCSSLGMEAAGALHVGPGRSPAMKAALSTWVRVVRDFGSHDVRA